MSNKPKKWLPLMGKVVTAWDRYCARWVDNGVNCLRKFNNRSKHQGSKPGRVMHAAMQIAAENV